MVGGRTCNEVAMEVGEVVTGAEVVLPESSMPDMDAGWGRWVKPARGHTAKANNTCGK